MNMKQAIFSLVFLLAATWAHAQLTLDECQRGAQANYPLVRQYGLIERHANMICLMPERDICPSFPCRVRLPIKVI